MVISPFSVCSMICRMAFFRLFARSISCSRGLKMDTAEGGGAERGEQDGALRGEEGRWAGSGSRGSSAMVGEGGAGRADKAWDSSLRVFSRESSFSFSTPHCSRHTHTHRQGSETHTHTHTDTGVRHKLWQQGGASCTLRAIASDSSELSLFFS